MHEKSPKTLTPKHLAAIELFLAGKTMSEAFAVGWGQGKLKKATVQSRSWRFFKQPMVKAEVERRVHAAMNRMEITADKVLGAMARIAFFDPRRLYDNDGRMKTIPRMSEDEALALASFEVDEIRLGGDVVVGETKKAKFYSKPEVLTTLMKYLKLLADEDGDPANKVPPTLIAPTESATAKEWRERYGPTKGTA